MACYQLIQPQIFWHDNAPSKKDNYLVIGQKINGLAAIITSPALIEDPSTRSNALCFCKSSKFRGFESHLTSTTCAVPIFRPFLPALGQNLLVLGCLGGGPS